ncbi:hypothetical protein CONCODRAFT_19340 [Conidiobolus coronatus NRRL 28638]|uniref:F-box domain-containing protein n=1 Tax=Conidiobolus coronatus (strain ATCC 28846 / CBS 209.66 / NRRL 28638) TaxID=796925 RepID=A0A137NYC9_CONC2|nr:hypothetical protein CONCODRAFT_19340 [Conidiobolus coronatus NRRL 28638]|eukprot:KXN67870.1 hypothetical protein CONCODRAFT_19340 [Conidiobolus coronatus NRRL 28638]
MNKKIDDSRNIEEVNWKNFPDTYHISLYLTHNDLIQLSLTCKYLRLKFKSKILSKLALLSGGEIIPGKPNESDREKQFAILAGMLEEKCLDRYDTINHCIIWGFINRSFAKKFFNLFANITRLELYSNYYERYFVDSTIGSNTILTEILYPLKNLESLILSSELINSSESLSKLDLKLPNSLKILHLIESYYNVDTLNYYPIENIDEGYTNLKKLTIINNNMLKNITTKIESLTDVAIFSRQHYRFEKLSQFFTLNSQLKKLTIPENFLRSSIIKTVLQMSQLKQLNVNLPYHKGDGGLYSNPINTSIEHLNLSCNIDIDILVPILNNFKSLKVLEYSNFDFCNFLKVDLSELSCKLPLLHLNNLFNAKCFIDFFLNPEAFDKIRFTNMFNLSEYLMEYGGVNMKRWKLYRKNPVNNSDFWITKINNNKSYL